MGGPCPRKPVARHANAMPQGTEFIMANLIKLCNM